MLYFKSLNMKENFLFILIILVTVYSSSISKF